MEKIKNLLDLSGIRDIAKMESITGEKALSEFLEMITQATKEKKKDNVKWLCYFFLESVKKEQVAKQVVKIAIGPILSNIVPLIQKKIEIRCGAKIQSCDFGDESKFFFAERIESTADIFSADSAIRKKLNELAGKKAMEKEIEEAVEKLDNAFKVFNGILNRIMI